MIAEFDNIPKVRTRRLADRFRYLKARIAKDVEECEAIRENISASLGVGSYESCTVYKVGETKVSGYTRGAFTAIRARPTG